jgi:hypothetical protein
MGVDTVHGQGGVESKPTNRESMSELRPGRPGKGGWEVGEKGMIVPQGVRRGWEGGRAWGGRGGGHISRMSVAVLHQIAPITTVYATQLDRRHAVLSGTPCRPD